MSICGPAWLNFDLICVYSLELVWMKVMGVVDFSWLFYP